MSFSRRNQIGLDDEDSSSIVLRHNYRRDGYLPKIDSVQRCAEAAFDQY